MILLWKENIEVIAELLNNLSITDKNGKEHSHDEGFQEWVKMALRVRDLEHTAYFIGNGASASMASHFAIDTAKNVGLRTTVFSDNALVTALANDLCYEEVFAEPLRWYMKEADMLVAISSSGNSPNIVRAVETARQFRGHIVTLSAMRDNNAIRKLGDLNFYIPAQSYGLAETGHAAILHYWMDLLEIKRK